MTSSNSNIMSYFEIEINFSQFFHKGLFFLDLEFYIFYNAQVLNHDFLNINLSVSELI